VGKETRAFIQQYIKSVLAGLFFVVFKMGPRSILTVNHSMCLHFLYFLS